MTRTLRAVPAPTDERVLDLLPLLADALAGTGPAILPLGATDPRAAAITSELAAGTRLGADEDDPNDPTALVIATSGSTGVPKGVLLSASQLAASADATERRLGGPGNWLLALPAAHIAGMQVLLRAARAGSEIVAMDRERPFAARDFTAAASRLGGRRRYVSLVPTQLLTILDDPDASRATAEIFDAVLVGGSAVDPRLVDRALLSGIPVVTTYGMTETCGGCIYDGQPLAGVTATVEGAGALTLTGPMVARGYRGRPGDPAFPRPGTFVTSDHGEITADGTVLVHGRLDDIIITGGVKVAPAAVEAALRALPGIADALVVGVADPKWGQVVAALVVPVPGAPHWDVARLRAELGRQGRLPGNQRPWLVRHADTLPLLPSGKPDRSGVAGSWNPPAG